MFYFHTTALFWKKMKVDYPITKPHAIDEWARAELTISCRDCDVIAKHPQAGKVEIDADGKKWQTMHNGLLVEYGGYYGTWMASIISALRGHRTQAGQLVAHAENDVSLRHR